MTHKASCGNQTLLFTEMLKASQRLLPSKATYGGGCGAICYWQRFFSLSCPRNFVLFIEILTLALIFFIFNFCSWPFCKISIYFQFHP